MSLVVPTLYCSNRQVLHSSFLMGVIRCSASGFGFGFEFRPTKGMERKSNFAKYILHYYISKFHNHNLGRVHQLQICKAKSQIHFMEQGILRVHGPLQIQFVADCGMRKMRPGNLRIEYHEYGMEFVFCPIYFYSLPLFGCTTWHFTYCSDPITHPSI